MVSEVYVMRISTQIPVESSTQMNTGSPLVGGWELMVINLSNINLIYLRHQWSYGADTLQFGSTGEYFETVEYETDRPVEH